MRLIERRIKLLKALAGLLGTLGERRKPLLVLRKRLLEGGTELIELRSQAGNLLRKLGKLLLGLPQALLPGGRIDPESGYDIAYVCVRHTLPLDSIPIYIYTYFSIQNVYHTPRRTIP